MLVGGVRRLSRLADLRRRLQEETPSQLLGVSDEVTMLPEQSLYSGQHRRVFIETYGCQMNSSDTEIVQSILQSSGYRLTTDERVADVILLNTCAIRDNAEQKIWNRLEHFRPRRGPAVVAPEEDTTAWDAAALRRRIRDRRVTVGILGCMAERLKSQLLDERRLVDVVVGPDAYRDLPHLLAAVHNQEQSSAMNVQLSVDETYADITPVRVSENGLSAFVTIMRGCNELCSYCIVPFTRGRERSRPLASIAQEVSELAAQGFKEITLLGQNVNAYNDLSSAPATAAPESMTFAPGFGSNVKTAHVGTRFATLLDHLSSAHPDLRFRFTSPHPKDFTDDLWQLIAARPNICKGFHIPAQSGSSAVLERMRRQYTREAYLDLIKRMRTFIPDAAVSSDFISGFCGETEAEHQETLSLLREVDFDQAFMFAYSMREKTRAHRRLQDDVPEEVKKRRLAEVIDTFYHGIKIKNRQEVGRFHVILLEETSKKSDEELAGRSDTNKRVIIDPRDAITDLDTGLARPPRIGDYVRVQITDSFGPSLKGTAVALASSFLSFT